MYTCTYLYYMNNMIPIKIVQSTEQSWSKYLCRYRSGAEAEQLKKVVVLFICYLLVLTSSCVYTI